MNIMNCYTIFWCETMPKSNTEVIGNRSAPGNTNITSDRNMAKCVDVARWIVSDIGFNIIWRGSVCACVAHVEFIGLRLAETEGVNSWTGHSDWNYHRIRDSKWGFESNVNCEYTQSTVRTFTCKSWSNLQILIDETELRCWLKTTHTRRYTQFSNNKKTAFLDSFFFLHLLQSISVYYRKPPIMMKTTKQNNKKNNSST